MEGEKTEQPTPRKLKKAREKGEVWKSVEVIHTAQFAVMLLLGWLLVALYLPRLGALFDAWPVFISAAAASPQPAAQVATQAAEQATQALLLAWAPVIVVPFAVGVFAAAMQVRGVFSMDPLVPKAERLNPGANLKRLVSSRNLIDLVKTLSKVVLIGLAVVLSLQAALPQWVQAAAVPQAPHTGKTVSLLLGQSLLALALACLALYVFVAAADYAHQYYEYMKQQRMTKDEVRREYKEMEGDPYIKGHRMGLARALANEGPAQLATARVVVTNPTHLSVALAYDAAAGGLPSVVAKGADAAAMAIRHEARRLGIPVVENKPLARRLYAQVAVGSFITADTFADVARLLAAAQRPARGTSEHWGKV
jgi:type III secretion protein U